MRYHHANTRSAFISKPSLNMCLSNVSFLNNVCTLTSYRGCTPLCNFLFNSPEKGERKRDRLCNLRYSSFTIKETSRSKQRITTQISELKAMFPSCTSKGFNTSMVWISTSVKSHFCDSFFQTGLCNGFTHLLCHVLMGEICKDEFCLKTTNYIQRGKSIAKLETEKGG